MKKLLRFRNPKKLKEEEKAETWKTVRATNCSSLAVSWCQSFLWYRSAREAYHSPSSGWALRSVSRYCSGAAMSGTLNLERERERERESENIKKQSEKLGLCVLVFVIYLFIYIYIKRIKDFFSVKKRIVQFY